MTDLDIAVNILGGDKNKVMYDDIGLPSIMVEVAEAPLTIDDDEYGGDTPHHAFLVNQKRYDKFYVSKYQNVVMHGRAYSLPMQAPKLNSNFYDAFDACKAKGLGWHLMTNAEWAYLALQGHLPRGNNNGGGDYRGDRGGSRVTLANLSPGEVIFTGSGPLSFSHNGESSGIWDLNGNVSEWVSGLRLVDGEIQIFMYNDAADFTNFQWDETDHWRTICNGVSYGPPDHKNSLKFDHNSESMEYPVLSETISFRQNDGTVKSECTFKNLSVRGNTFPRLARVLAIAPWDDTDDGYISVKNIGIRPALRGGGAADGEKAGIRSLSFCELGDYSAFGFRSCYIDLLESAVLSDETGAALATENGIIVN